MAYPIFSQEWAREYGLRLAESQEYKKAAAKWEWPLVLHIKADPSAGITEGVGVYLDLFHGDCRDARVATAEDLVQAPYVVSADLYTWRQVLDRKIEPISGIMRGKIKLMRGNVLVLAGYIPAARYLVEVATKVNTIFPEGAARP